MKIRKSFLVTMMLLIVLIISACGSSSAQEGQSDEITSQENHTEEPSNQAEDKASAEEESAEEHVFAYPFLVWADGNTFKIITDESLPSKLIGKKLGEVTTVLTTEEVGQLKEGDTYKKLDRTDGESNYLAKGSAIYQLKQADASEVVLVEHEGAIYKAVRIGN